MLTLSEFSIAFIRFMTLSMLMIVGMGLRLGAVILLFPFEFALQFVQGRTLKNELDALKYDLWVAHAALIMFADEMIRAQRNAVLWIQFFKVVLSLLFRVIVGIIRGVILYDYFKVHYVHGACVLLYLALDFRRSFFSFGVALALDVFILIVATFMAGVIFPFYYKKWISESMYNFMNGVFPTVWMWYFFSMFAFATLFGNPLGALYMCSIYACLTFSSVHIWYGSFDYFMLAKNVRMMMPPEAREGLELFPEYHVVHGAVRVYVENLFQQHRQLHFERVITRYGIQAAEEMQNSGADLSKRSDSIIGLIAETRTIFNQVQARDRRLEYLRISDNPVFQRAMVNRRAEILRRRMRHRQRVEQFVETHEGVQANLQIVNFLLNNEFIIDLIEDLFILHKNVAAVGDNSKVPAVMAFIKSRFKTSLTKQLSDFYLNLLFDNPYGVQAGEEDENDWKSFVKHGLDKYVFFKHSDFCKKLAKFMMFVCGTSMFARYGLNVDLKAFEKLFGKAESVGLFKGPDLVHSLLDMILFLCERGNQCLKTGSLEPLFHCADRYQKWMDEVDELKRDEKFAGNSVVGTNIYKFIHDLRHNIEIGESMYKYCSGANPVYKNLIRTRLDWLKTAQREMINVRAAMLPRRPPLAILVFGPSSVGKSCFTECLYKYYAHRRNLPSAPEYKYTRNSKDEYWTNFFPDMWCIVTDDVAYRNPDFKVEDESLTETICVVNTVPYVPSQASLEDKGRNPVRPELCLATTNRKDLWANAYFAEPYAVQRRFPYVVSPIPKKKYSKNGQLCPALIPECDDGSYPDLWDIRVETPVAPQNEHGMGTYKEVAYFDNMGDFLDFYSKMIDTHAINVEKAERALKNFDQVRYCATGIHPIDQCKCVMVTETYESVTTQQRQRGQIQADELAPLTRWQKVFKFFGFKPDHQSCVCHGGVERCYHRNWLCEYFVHCPAYHELMGIEDERQRKRGQVQAEEWTATQIARSCMEMKVQADEYLAEYRLWYLESKLNSMIHFVWNALAKRVSTAAVGYLLSKDDARSIVTQWRDYSRDLENRPMNKDECTYMEYLQRSREAPEEEKPNFWVLSWAMLSFNVEKYTDFFLRFFLAVVWESMIWMRWFLSVVVLLWWYGWISIATYVLTTLACSFVNSILVFSMADLVRTPLRDRLLRYMVTWYGNKMASRMSLTLKVTIVAVGVLQCFGCYSIWKAWCVQRRSEIGIQGNVASKIAAIDCDAVRPKPYLERKDVWRNDGWYLNRCDLPDALFPLGADGETMFNDIIVRSCATIEISQWDDSGKVRRGKAFNFKGKLWLCNNHTLPKVDTFTILFVQDPVDRGVGRNVSFKTSPRLIWRDKDRDLCVIHAEALPFGRDLMKFFLERDLGLNCVFDGWYLGINRDGKGFHKRIHKIQRKCTNYPELGIDADVWNGRIDEPTEHGDCGAVLCTTTAYGRFIAGIHVWGNADSEIESLVVMQHDLARSIVHFSEQFSATPVHLSCQAKAVELVQLHGKSPVRFIQQGVADVQGSIQGYASKNGRSRTSISPIAGAVERNMGYTVKHGAPVMSGWEPWAIAMESAVQKPMLADLNVLDACVEDYVRDIKKDVPKSEWNLVEEYDMFTAVNGSAGVSYVNKLNRNTSTGHPWRTCKRKMMEPIPPEDGLSDPVMVNEEIIDCVQQGVESYLNHGTMNPVFTGSCKDEALPFRKIREKRTRIFTGSPVPFSIVTRKFLLCLVRIIHRNQFAFGCAAGIVCQSKEWEKLRAYITHFGPDGIHAGDYKQFDKTVDSVFQSAVWRIIVRLIAYAYDLMDDLDPRKPNKARHVTVVTGIGFDTTHALVNFAGDLIRFYGSVPSGFSLTVEINTFVGDLYMRYCFKIVCWEYEFRMCVHFMGYGDDNLMGVAVQVRRMFTFRRIVEEMKRIGVTYTTADKTEATKDFIDISEATFLKRSWRWDEDFRSWVGPLDEDSIAKMLTVWTYSTTITESVQAIEVIGSAMREFAWYGRETYEARRRQLQTVVLECGLLPYVQENTFPPFQSLVDEFVANSAGVEGSA